MELRDPFDSGGTSRGLTMLHPACPVCGGETDKASLQGPYFYWRCRACGSSHLHPQPPPETLDCFYADFHASAERGGLFADFEARMIADFPAKARIVGRYLGVRENGMQAAPRVLDVGCGKGFFVQELSRLGMRVEGIDIAEAAVRQGQENLGIRGLRTGRIEEQADWRTCFDGVTCWATIEHMPSPKRFFESVRRVMKPGGYLFLDTGLADDFLDR